MIFSEGNQCWNGQEVFWLQLQSEFGAQHVQEPSFKQRQSS